MPSVPQKMPRLRSSCGKKQKAMAIALRKRRFFLCSVLLGKKSGIVLHFSEKISRWSDKVCGAGEIGGKGQMIG